MGFFVGFVYSTYSRSPLGIFRNIVTSGIFIFTIKSMRESLILNGRYYKRIIIYSLIIFTLFELIGIFNLSILSTKRLMLEFFLSMVCPILFKNILLTYLMYFSSKKITILYQCLYILPTYILGIFPNLGDYVTSTLQTILPIIVLFFLLKIRDVKRERIIDGRTFLHRKKISYIVLSICIVFTALLIYLVSGLGRYYLMAIGSGSMTGVINKGDIVFIDKKSKTHKIGQVIAFKMEGKIIVHRIIDVQITDKGTFYKTKGDYNNGEDGWLLPEANIVGNCILKIPLIGWPSVILSEFINR